MTFSVDEEWREGVDADGRPVWEVRYYYAAAIGLYLVVCAAGAWRGVAWRGVAWRGVAWPEVLRRLRRFGGLLRAHGSVRGLSSCVP